MGEKNKGRPTGKVVSHLAIDWVERNSTPCPQAYPPWKRSSSSDVLISAFSQVRALRLIQGRTLEQMLQTFQSQSRGVCACRGARLGMLLCV